MRGQIYGTKLLEDALAPAEMGLNRRRLGMRAGEADKARAAEPIAAVRGGSGGDPVPGWIWIAGKSASRGIVERCRSRVILGSGCAPEHVAAIAAVHSWRADACAGLGLYPGKEDLDRCGAFNARAGAA